MTVPYYHNSPETIITPPVIITNRNNPIPVTSPAQFPPRSVQAIGAPPAGAGRLYRYAAPTPIGGREWVIYAREI